MYIKGYLQAEHVKTDPSSKLKMVELEISKLQSQGVKSDQSNISKVFSADREALEQTAKNSTCVRRREEKYNKTTSRTPRSP